MIPKTIHKVIIVDDGKLPELPDGMKKSIETFYRMNPGYKVNIFSEMTVWHTSKSILMKKYLLRMRN